MTSRVQKTEVVKKSWNFAGCSYFASCVMKKHYFFMEESRGGSWDFGKMDGLCRPPRLATEENFRFQMVWKGQNNVRNYKFWAKYFYQYFQFFSIFIYNESLPMKSYLNNEHSTNKFSLLTKCACMTLN